MPAFNFVRASFYRDSVTLMRLAGVMEAVAGVTRAAAMMGTPANRALLEQAGVVPQGGAAARPPRLAGAGVAEGTAAGRGARPAAAPGPLAPPPPVRRASRAPPPLRG